MEGIAAFGAFSFGPKLRWEMGVGGFFWGGGGVLSHMCILLRKTERNRGGREREKKWWLRGKGNFVGWKMRRRVEMLGSAEE